MIRLKNVSKTYQGKNSVHALTGIDLNIPAGQIYGIIGQSGAGKSTLLRCINMLERPEAGEVWVGDTLMTSLSPKELRAARRRIGMVFQQFNLLNSRTVFGNIAFPLELNGTPGKDVRSRVEELAELVGLADKLRPTQGSSAEVRSRESASRGHWPQNLQFSSAMNLRRPSTRRRPDPSSTCCRKSTSGSD